VETIRPRLVPAPRTEPEFDQEFPVRRRAGQAALPFDAPDATAPCVAQILPGPRCAGDSPVAGPDPRRWCAVFARALVEVLTGTRQAAQLSMWTTRPVLALLERRSNLLLARRVGRASARAGRIILCEPAAGVLEASLTLHDNARVRAVAFRLELYDGRWLCTAIDIG
jgi:hypothetical protein